MKLKAVLKILVPILCILATTEIISYIYFKFFIPAGLRESAYFTVHSLTSSKKQPDIKPYLWSNYAPNPLSANVNKFGWRYGGCTKEKRFRIFCSGGSTTWSIMASSPEKSYPAQLEKYLQGLGYDVDVVNGGVSYYTSAEELGTLLFRGIYTKPDLVLIHTGGNDILPFMSPKEYKPDYTHWRTIDDGYDNISRNDLFRICWRIPSWLFRVIATLRLRPDAFTRMTIGKQLEEAQETFLATNNFSDRQPLGLENNLKSMIAVSQANKADVVTTLFNLQSSKLHIALMPYLKNDPEKYQEVKDRCDLAMKIANNTIQKVSDEMGVSVIPFDKFVPSHDDFWVDQCHLNDEGINEKAVFIGKWLIGNGILNKINRSK